MAGAGFLGLHLIAQPFFPLVKCAGSPLSLYLIFGPPRSHHFNGRTYPHHTTCQSVRNHLETLHPHDPQK